MGVRKIYTCLFDIFIFVVISLKCQHALCDQGPGWVNPSTIEQFIGGDFNISCTINKTYFKNSNETCEVQDLYFRNREGRNYKEPDIRAINETTIVYIARNVSQQEDEYYCMCGKYAIMSSKVYIGTEPLSVTDFACSGYDYLYMVCNFTMPNNSVITKYNVSYNTQSRKGNYRYDVECNFDRAPIVVCNITDEDYKKFADILYFKLDISNSLGHNSQDIEINNFERNVPSRPGQNLTVVNKTANAICLRWEMPRRSNYGSRGLQWQVRLQPLNFPVLNRTMWRNNTSAQWDTLCLDDLPYAGYDYELNLRVRANTPAANYSAPLLYTFRTADERPRRPPRITAGSFYVDSSETQLRFYWEQLERFEYNGEGFQYIIKTYIKNGIFRNPAEIKVESNSAIIKNYDKDAYHEILIQSVNNVNTSIEFSRFVIAPVSDVDLRRHVPKDIRSVYHANNRSYTLSWAPPVDSRNLLNYTVFWCSAKPAKHSECDGSIHFQNVSSMDGTFTTAAGQTQSLNMAVAANYPQHNTGMHWLICTRDVTDDLAKMEPTIDAVTNSSLFVKWNTDRICPVILVGYNLTYCQKSVGKLDNCTTVVIRDRYAKSYEIRDLEPYTYYSVKMLMHSETKASKYSDELINHTGEAAPTQPRQLQLVQMTNSSVTISWQPPLKTNGIVRNYEAILQHNNKTDFIKWPASTTELVDKDKPVVHELNNLTAYTEYVIAMRAITLYASQLSNEIRLRTTVGVPSAPSLHTVVNEADQTTLKWKAPEEPAGRIDYYEVTINDNSAANGTQREQRISYIMGYQNHSCVMMTPTCMPMGFQYQVRAVNVEPLTKLSAVLSARAGSQQCEPLGGPLTDRQWGAIEEYRNESLYRLHKSEWSRHSVSCFSENVSYKTFVRSFEVVGPIFVLGIIFYFGYGKVRKMSNIDCTLPPGIMESLKKSLENGVLNVPDTLPSGGNKYILDDVSPESVLQQHVQQDFSCGSESVMLLRSIAGMPGRCNGTDSSNSYSYMDNAEPDADGSEDPRHGENQTVSFKAIPGDSGYSCATGLMRASATARPNAANNGYIKPTQMKHWPTTVPSSNANKLPGVSHNQCESLRTEPSKDMSSLSGYVPVQVLQAERNAAPTVLNTSNYIQVSDLHKFNSGTHSDNALLSSPELDTPMPNSFGYTTMEQHLIKPTAFGSGVTHSPAVAANQQISGYVTPQDLNALAHKTQVL